MTVLISHGKGETVKNESLGGTDDAVVIPTPQADPDYYRVGTGIDLVNLVSMLRAKNQRDRAQANA